MMDETLDTVTGVDVDDMEEEIQTEVNKVSLFSKILLVTSNIRDIIS